MVMTTPEPPFRDGTPTRFNGRDCLFPEDARACPPDISGADDGKDTSPGKEDLSSRPARVIMECPQGPDAPGWPDANAGMRRQRPELASQRLEHVTMTAEPPESPVTEAVRSLEVRWIF